MSTSEIQAIFTALSPIFTWVAPIVLYSLSLWFIRSFFD